MKTFLIINTANYSDGELFCEKVEVNNVTQLEKWGWMTDEEYNLLNTDEAITIGQMEVGDCVESNEFHGKDATLYRIG